LICGEESSFTKCPNGHRNYYLFLAIILISIFLSILGYSFKPDEIIVFLLFTTLMISVTISDILDQIVPDRLIVIFLPLLVILRIIFPTTPWYDAYLGSILAFATFYLIAFIGEKVYKKEAVGGGDIKLYAVIGLFLGVELTFLSIFLASVAGLVFTKLFGRLIKSDYLPFVPFIFIGTFLSYFCGDMLLDWYFGLF